MPEEVDPKVEERCVRQVLEHLPEFPPQIDGGQRQGASSEELAEIEDLRAKVRRLEEDNRILRRASIFFARELDPRNR